MNRIIDKEIDYLVKEMVTLYTFGTIPTFLMAMGEEPKHITVWKTEELEKIYEEAGNTLVWLKSHRKQTA